MAPRPPAPAPGSGPEVPPPHLEPPRGGAPHLAARSDPARPADAPGQSARPRARARPSGGEGRPSPPPPSAAKGGPGARGAPANAAGAGPAWGQERPGRKKPGAGSYSEPRAASGPVPSMEGTKIGDLTLRAAAPVRPVAGARSLSQRVRKMKQRGSVAHPRSPSW
ncbi:uncharacterized protein LOC143690409 [Tamandua tetradactyla]|uniref:uncharacterized protein LOC143690409 n=1 Tax=Tamandua tetradactyla TaxID=48850 RepID=UPI0040542122